MYPVILGNWIAWFPSWWFQPSLKILVKIGIFPKDRGEHKKCLKPPPEPRKKKPRTFHYTGCLIGILIVVYYKIPI